MVVPTLRLARHVTIHLFRCVPPAYRLGVVYTPLPVFIVVVAAGVCQHLDTFLAVLPGAEGLERPFRS